MAPAEMGDEERPLRLKAHPELADVPEELLIAACTHASYASEKGRPASDSYQRLEFLGDAVLDAVVAECLFSRFPDWDEGSLTRAKAAVVAESGLVPGARRLELGDALRLGRGEESSGGRSKPSLLAGAFEAVVAAVFIGRGLDAARQFVLGCLGPEIDAAAHPLASENHKSELQELSQARTRETPTYRLERTRGPDHDKWFEVEAVVDGGVVGRGEGSNRKAAEQAAAADALTRAEEWLAPAAE